MIHIIHILHAFKKTAHTLLGCNTLRHAAGEVVQALSCNQRAAYRVLGCYACRNKLGLA